MSEQRIDALIATIDAHIAEVFRLRRERDELRAALAELMDNRGSMAALERAQEILNRTAPKAERDELRMALERLLRDMQFYTPEQMQSDGVKKARAILARTKETP